jgi:Fe2+ or Zn2+ uptake regulation protein
MRMIRKNELIAILNDKKIKPSTARLNILHICVMSNTPLDVQAVAKKLPESIHLATVYRTLETFVAAGILEKIDFQEGKFRYEYMHDHHHHAICNNCGKVEDITDAGIEAIESKIAKKTGFAISKHVLELFGLCIKCQRSNQYV